MSVAFVNNRIKEDREAHMRGVGTVCDQRHDASSIDFLVTNPHTSLDKNFWISVVLFWMALFVSQPCLYRHNKLNFKKDTKRRVLLIEIFKWTVSGHCVSHGPLFKNNGVPCKRQNFNPSRLKRSICLLSIVFWGEKSNKSSYSKKTSVFSQGHMNFHLRDCCQGFHAAAKHLT